MKVIPILLVALALTKVCQQSIAAPPPASVNPVLAFAEIVKSNNPESWSECSVIKIETDLDGNGSDDYMLSTYCAVSGDSYPIGGWGNAGGNWDVYLSIDDNFVLYPTPFFHPPAYHYQPVGIEGVFSILLYHRLNANGGVYAIYQYRTPYRGYSDVGSKGELLFSEEVDCEGGCAVSEKNEYLLEGALTVEAVWCDLDSFFGGKCEWKNLY